MQGIGLNSLTLGWALCALGYYAGTALFNSPLSRGLREYGLHIRDSALIYGVFLTVSVLVLELARRLPEALGLKTLSLEEVSGFYGALMGDAITIMMTIAGVGIGITVGGAVLGTGPALGSIWAGYTTAANLLLSLSANTFAVFSVYANIMSRATPILLNAGAVLLGVPHRLTRGAGGLMLGLCLANASLLTAMPHLAVGLSGVGNFQEELAKYKNQDWRAWVNINAGTILLNPMDPAYTLAKVMLASAVVMAVYAALSSGLSKAFGGAAERIAP